MKSGTELWQALSFSHHFFPLLFSPFFPPMLLSPFFCCCFSIFFSLGFLPFCMLSSLLSPLCCMCCSCCCSVFIFLSFIFLIGGAWLLTEDLSVESLFDGQRATQLRFLVAPTRCCTRPPPTKPAVRTHFLQCPVQRAASCTWARCRVGLPGPGAYRGEDCTSSRFQTPASALFGSSGRHSGHPRDWHASVPGPGAYAIMVPARFPAE